MKKRTKKKLKKAGAKVAIGIYHVIKLIILTPYYAVKYAIVVEKKIDKKVKEVKVKKKRTSIKSNYKKFEVIEEITGSFKEWEITLAKSDSTIGIILGARGTGKSAIALKIFENLYAKKKTTLYAIGMEKEELPSWIKVVDSIEKIKNNSHILIDEGGILFNSRKSMSNANTLLSELLLIARHKNLSILFISQNSSNLEINILRQADYLILKPSSLLQKNFERKIIKELYTKSESHFNEYKCHRGITYIHSDSFSGFIANSLPSFWTEGISKSWKDK